MNDRTLLELAAKAAGIEFSWVNNDGARLDRKPGVMQPYVRWNPLTDDGDALRLAVKLRLIVECGANRTIVFHPGADESVKKPIEWYEQSDPYAATRRAIVRAAAEIGRNMP